MHSGVTTILGHKGHGSRSRC